MFICLPIVAYVIQFKCQESKSDLEIIQDAIQGKLKKRAVLREETVSKAYLPEPANSKLIRAYQALLHLLLKISESVTRLESLLLIAPPAQDATSPPDIHGLKMPSHLSTIEDEHLDTRLGLVFLH